MKKWFKKKEIFKVKSQSIDPVSLGEPVTATDYQQRGMVFYARKKYKDAETDLQKAILLDNGNIDAYYCLGMVLKAMHDNKAAEQAFTQVLALGKDQNNTTKTKYDMLKRLALGHINAMTQGDWNLEKEIWQHTA